MKAILAIDQGTTGTTVAVMNSRGALLGSVNNEFPQIFPKPGWVEHEPEAIWKSVLKGIRAVFRKGLCKPTDIACIGIGENGHIAFNDPPPGGADFSDPQLVKKVALDEACRKQQLGEGGLAFVPTILQD